MPSKTAPDAPLSLRDSSLRQDFESLLERSFQCDLKPGAVAVGEVLSVERDGLLVDIGGKSEGFVPLKEIQGRYSAEEMRTTFAVGQIREFYIVSQNDNDSVYYQLSLRRVTVFKNWEELRELKERNATIDVVVAGATKGGILVNALDLKGFIPASQIRVAKTLNELVGETLPAKILEVDKAKNKLILSNRAAVFEAKAAMRAETLSRLHEGDRVVGEIVKVTDFGVFIDINGIDGLLPLSEISWRRIHHPSEALELGQRLEVMVLTVDLSLQRISLTRKRLEDDPWRTVDDHFHVNQELEGRITKILGSGVLVELMPGIEAYCAFSGAGDKFFERDETCGFRIVSINGPDRRLTLEYRYDAAPPPVSQDAPASPERVLAAV